MAEKHLTVKTARFHVTQFFGKDSPPTGAGLPKKHLTNETLCVSCVSNFSDINPKDKQSDTLVEPSVLWSSPPPVGISEATLWSCAPYGISGATLWSCAPEGGTLIR